MPTPQAYLTQVATAANTAATAANDAAASLQVLAAQNLQQLTEAAEVAARRQLRSRATDLALKLTVAKLEAIPAGEGNLDTLVRTATALDPDQQQSGQTIQVAVVFRQEGRVDS